MLLFRSEEHIARWSDLRGTPRGEHLSVGQQWYLAQAWYADRARPGALRKTVDEAEAVFAELGLIGAFWSLRD
jgi:hypothetical protein